MVETISQGHFYMKSGHKQYFFEEEERINATNIPVILPKTCRLVYLFNIEIKLHRIVIEKEEEMGIKLTVPMSASLHPWAAAPGLWAWDTGQALSRRRFL